MILITSAAYIDKEFGVELGQLPPTFLPVGNRKLYEHQFESLSTSFPNEDIWLSLPEDFVPDAIYSSQLDNFGIKVIHVPTGFDLSKSLLYCVNSIGIYNQTLRVLHGDTLLGSYPKDLDAISIGEPRDDYTWQIDIKSNKDSWVWAGYFSFSNIPLLARELTASSSSFVNAVKCYQDSIHMKRVQATDWLDFGHINTFYKARTHITTQRNFNDLRISEGTVWKSGFPENKIESEGLWFYNLPPQLKIYTPQLIDRGITPSGSPFYETEYLCAIPLNEAFVHGRNPSFFWDKIFSICATWFEKSTSYQSAIATDQYLSIRKSIVVNKTIRRIDSFFTTTPENLQSEIVFNKRKLPSLSKITEEMIGLVDNSELFPGIVHGDLCLSNMIYDSRSENLKFIDPRGLDDEGNFMNYGDVSYDYAKLTHSIIGLYDFIISNALVAQRDGMKFEFNVNMDHRINEIQEKFVKANILKQSKVVDIMPQVILLFLSMLPLHSDSKSKQDTLLANALRLYALYFSGH